MGKFEKSRAKRNEEEAELEKAFREVSGYSKTKSSASKSQKSKKKKITIILCVIALVLAIAAGGTCAWYYFSYTGDDGKILNNVYFMNLDLGGLTPEEASQVVEMYVDDSFTTTDMLIHLPNEDITLSPADTGVKLDVDTLISDAYAYGRQGTAAEQRQARKEAATKENHLDPIPYLGLDDGYIQSVLAELNTKYNSTLSQPTTQISGTRPALTPDTLDLTAPTQVITVTLGIPESALNTQELYVKIIDAYSQMVFEITHDFSIVQPEVPDLKALYEEHYIAPVDAKFDEETYEVISEIYGYGFDLDAAVELLKQTNPGESFEIQLDFIAPEVTGESLKDTLFLDLLGSCTAYQASSAARCNNLTLACKAVNGTILKPGEVFSYNETLGERTVEKGYMGAGAYVGGETVTAIGGGICQVSSSIYYSVLHADLEVVERYNHMYPTGYVPLGMDATVDWGNLDFRFRNNTNHPIRIDAYSDGAGTVTIEIYGTDEKDYYVEMTYEVLKTYPSTTVYKEMDANNPDGYRDGDVIQTAYTGYDVKTYKNKYSKADDSLISVEFDDLSDYDKRDKIICKIRVPEPEPTTPPATTTPPETTTSPEDNAVG